MIWNAFGFHVVDKLLTGAKINSDYFTTTILAPLEEKVSRPEERHTRNG
jgi:hypothetical protein